MGSGWRWIGVAGVPLCLAALTPGASGAPATQDAEEARGGAATPCRTSYVIRARYDPATRGIEGEETLRWENRTDDTVGELWFHLYHNAFANTFSTHLFEGRGRVRSGRRVGDEEFGWQRVTSITVEGTELVGRARYESPDDERSEDRTVFRVGLPRPVGPGESVDVHVVWEAKLPRVRRRTGYKDDFLFAAHWFPKLAVYEGGRGWNAHQFHRDTEFYSDFGTYDVTLDLPAEYQGRIGASGVQIGAPEREADRVVTRFVAPSHQDRERIDVNGERPLVHGFAWTADPDFEVREALFEWDAWSERFPEEVASVAAALGREPSELRGRDVLVRVMIQPERLSQWRRHYEATAAALFFYGLWFGPYPYEQVTVVDPPWGGGAAGGMEYPTLFTAGTRLFTRPSMHRPESVTVHEAGHQFWYGLVGNNEFEAAWMDEGFNSYADSEVMVRVFGLEREATWYSSLPVWGSRVAPLPGGGRAGEVLTLRRIPVGFGFALRPLEDSGLVDWWRDQPLLTLAPEVGDPRWGDRSGYLRTADVDPIATPGWQYADRASYRANSYPRPAVALRSLPALVGRDAFLRGMRHYSETWRYAHPYPDDFFAAFAEGSGAAVEWYFEEVFRGTSTVDWRLDVAQYRHPKPSGFVQEAFGQPFTEIERPEGDEGEEDAFPEDAEAADEDGGEDGDDAEADGRPWHYDVRVHRSGELRLPVDIEVRFEDGATQRFTWSREDQEGSTWWRLPLPPGEAELAAVVIDPERLWYLDGDMSDNQWFDERDRVTPLRWSERVLTQWSQLLRWYAGIGG